VGEYLLLGSVHKDFGREGNLLAAQYFFVSNISYIRNEQSYFLLNRNTGQPLPNASIQVWASKYDYTDRKNKLRKAEWVTSDEHGRFQLNADKNDSRNIRLEIKWQDDYLFPDDYQYLYTRYYADEVNRSDAAYEQKNARLFFFTDRSIYRPGQIVYFKGIAITRNAANRKAKLITNQRVKVLLLDVNRQTLDSLTITLNEFGSVNGQFRLPQNALTGNFSIRTEGYNQSSSSFAVEEYKRPKFSVTIRKPTESYRVNDTVVVRGSAQAYAGNNIDGAQVRYRISREAKFFSPWLFFRRRFPATTAMEIANGVTTTDASGEFVLQFAALPDHSFMRSLDPVFDYTITVDVTDINGETRSSTEVIQIGYKAIRLEIGLAQKGPVAMDAFNSFSVTSENLNNEFEPVAASVNIYPLTGPGRLIRERYWEKPDQFLYTKEEYLRYFPHDEYDEERDYHNWTKGELMYSDTLTTAPGTAYVLSHASDKAKSKFQPGWYVIEVTAKDRFGTDVKAVEYVELYNDKSKELSVPAYQWNTDITQSVEPGGRVSVITGSSAEQVFLIQQIDRNKERIISPRDNETQRDSEYQFFNINKEKREFTYAITEADRGGFGIIQFFVKNNRFYLHSRQIDVPWTNKQLNISYISFRDKLEPGSREKWEVKISGKQGEKVAAETLVSMYDASLDQFSPHQWNVPQIWPNYWVVSTWLANDNFNAVESVQRDELKNEAGNSDPAYTKVYDQLMDLDMSYGGLLNDVVVTGYGMLRGRVPGLKVARESSRFTPPAVAMDMELQEMPKPESEDFANGEVEPINAATPSNNTPIRKNFNETSFFFPDLKTDSEGNVSFSFTTPEALTRWRLMTLAHTQSLAFGYVQQFAVTQKDLMVQPNAPRFVREKDHFSFSTKIANLSDGLVNGFARLELFDATTNRPVDDLFHNAVPVKNFSVAAGQSIALSFQLDIPEDFNTPLLYRISATSSQRTDGSTLTDGEENVIPVLNNRMLVTESLPLNMRGSGTKSFRFEKLLKQDTSAKSTLKNYALTVEYTPQPVWYAVQSLPYLIEYPYECSEQTFNRYYANTLASYIANSAPRIKEMYNQWQNDTSNGKSLVSALQKNEELKSILLQETPWVLQAQNETQQKQNIALLFDVVRMGQEAGANVNKLREMQTSNGGFVWFKGGQDNRYITQYILTGLGHLLKLNALSAESGAQWNSILSKALEYADERIREDYQELIKQKEDLNKNHLSGIAIQYLYMRSFFTSQKPKSGSLKAYQFYLQQAKRYWLKQSAYMKGMIALSLYRSDEQDVARSIIASLKENAMTHEDLGMYWKDIRPGFYWYEAPVETQSLLIEAFQEITKDTKSVEEMKLWLLKQKQTQHWGSTKSTAEACYALLLQGRNELNDQRPVTIHLGAKEYSSTENSEAGTGYFKFRLEGEDVSPAMGNIRVTVAPSSQGQGSASWGAVYWQYFEDLDKVSASSDNKAPLRLNKQLWVERNGERGPVLLPIDNNTGLKVGDKLKVRIELRADRDMEYVHMKDLRAAGTEPANVLSGYRWQDGLGYYESTRDASTNFFFSWLRKGTYVFEYPLFVTHQGDFSSGVTTIQCMYAPEFTSHSEGIRIKVSE
ncbi:MAG: alpha-2-macroglobulin, partial [Chitinophagaceae bacterium]|nr:alpha-2-macroglobulin [Chitinophagaceae bacterium]